MGVSRRAGDAWRSRPASMRSPGPGRARRRGHPGRPGRPPAARAADEAQGPAGRQPPAEGRRAAIREVRPGRDRVDRNRGAARPSQIQGEAGQRTIRGERPAARTTSAMGRGGGRALDVAPRPRARTDGALGPDARRPLAAPPRLGHGPRPPGPMAHRCPDPGPRAAPAAPPHSPLGPGGRQDTPRGLRPAPRGGGRAPRHGPGWRRLRPRPGRERRRPPACAPRARRRLPTKAEARPAPFPSTEGWDHPARQRSAVGCKSPIDNERTVRPNPQTTSP